MEIGGRNTASIFNRPLKNIRHSIKQCNTIRGFATRKFLVHPAKCTENFWKIPPILGKFQVKKFHKKIQNVRKIQNFT